MAAECDCDACGETTESPVVEGSIHLCEDCASGNRVACRGCCDLWPEGAVKRSEWGLCPPCDREALDEDRKREAARERAEYARDAEIDRRIDEARGK